VEQHGKHVLSTVRVGRTGYTKNYPFTDDMTMTSTEPLITTSRRILPVENRPFSSTNRHNRSHYCPYRQDSVVVLRYRPKLSISFDTIRCMELRCIDYMNLSQARLVDPKTVFHEKYFTSPHSSAAALSSTRTRAATSLPRLNAFSNSGWNSNCD
jgi:hypothetical protein